MKRESCMLKILPGKADGLFEAICANKDIIDRQLVKVNAKNASAWSVAGYLYLYAEFDDECSSINDILAPFECALMANAEFIAKPGEMRLMYHDIAIVRLDKKKIRHRVFATHLKPGCAEEYFSRHKKLIDARGDEIKDGHESNFTIWCANDEFIFGYCEFVRRYDREMTEEEKKSTIEWETRQLEIMDWFTDDVDWITGQTHEKMKNVFIQKGYEAE